MGLIVDARPGPAPRRPSDAQYRGEEIVGKIESRGQHERGRAARRRRRRSASTIGPQTEVFFQDSGDKKLFPNPSYRDLKAGMGVRFTYNDGNPTRIVVNFVPASTGSGTTAPRRGRQPAGQGPHPVRERGGREIRADVAGTSRTYTVDSGAAGAATPRDLVVLTVEDRNGAAGGHADRPRGRRSAPSCA